MFSKKFILFSVAAVFALLVLAHISGIIQELGRWLVLKSEESQYVIPIAFSIFGFLCFICVKALESQQAQSIPKGIKLSDGLCGRWQTNSCIVDYKPLVPNEDVIKEWDEYYDGSGWHKIVAGNRLIGTRYYGGVEMRRPIMDCGDCM